MTENVGDEFTDHFRPPASEENTMPDQEALLNEYDAFTSDECSAMRSFLRGGIVYPLRNFNQGEEVFFGKYECECVDFEDFWLGKVIDAGLFTVETVEKADLYTDYTFTPTDKLHAMLKASSTRYQKAG